MGTASTETLSKDRDLNKMPVSTLIVFISWKQHHPRIHIPVFGFLQSENVHSLSVATAPEISWTHAERQARYCHATLHPPPEFVELRPIIHGEHPDDSSLFRSGGNFQPVRTECQSCQRTIMGRDHYLRMLKGKPLKCFKRFYSVWLSCQIYCVEYLHFSYGRGAGKREETVVIVNTERTQPLGVGRGVAYCVEHLHVADVVQVQAFFKAHHKTSSSMKGTKNEPHKQLQVTQSRIFAKFNAKQ